MLISSIHSFIEKHALILPHNTIVVGLSGGPDSVFLVHLLMQLKQSLNLTIIAAHLDDHWRPDSHHDALFCKQLCDALNIPLIVAQANQLPFKIKFNGSREEVGRKMRRFFLEQVRNEHKADAIALAHHLQDQQETFFIRLLRGATLTGLVGMKPQSGVYIRPLLEVNKADIIAYLDAHGIAYLIDPLNFSDMFLRNRIRHHVMPALATSDARFNSNFLATLRRLQETEQFLHTSSRAIFEKIASVHDGTLHLDLEQFRHLDRVIQYRIVMHWLCQAKVPFPPTQRFLDEIVRFLRMTETKDHQIHHQWRIAKNSKTASIMR